MASARSSSCSAARCGSKSIARNGCRWCVIFGATALLWLLPSAPVPDDPLAVLNVRVVQPNIGQEDKWRPGCRCRGRSAAGALIGAPTAEPRLLLWPEAAVTDAAAGQPPGRMPPPPRPSVQRAPRHARPRRRAADRRAGGQFGRRHASRHRHQQHFRDRPGRQGHRPLRQGAPRPLWRISADAAGAVGDRACPAGAGRHGFRRRARVRARSTSAAIGARSASSCATKSSFPAGSSTRRTARASSSTRPTTPGSGAGARRSISPRRGCARPRKACR